MKLFTLLLATFSTHLIKPCNNSERRLTEDDGISTFDLTEREREREVPTFVQRLSSASPAASKEGCLVNRGRFLPGSSSPSYTIASVREKRDPLFLWKRFTAAALAFKLKFASPFAPTIRFCSFPITTAFYSIT